MPTAEEYEWAASQLEHGARRVERLATLVGDLHDRLGPSVIAGGVLSLLTGATLDVSERNALLVGRMLATDIATCRARAAVCRAYRDDLAAHRAELARWQSERQRLPPAESPPPPPRRPLPPASWVEP